MTCKKTTSPPAPADLQEFLGQVDLLAEQAANLEAEQTKEAALAAFRTTYAAKRSVALHRAAQETLDAIGDEMTALLTSVQFSSAERLLDLEAITGIHDLPELQLPSIQVPSLQSALESARAERSQLRVIHSDDVVSEAARALGLFPEPELIEQ
jgi:hypothetical protein